MSIVHAPTQPSTEGAGLIFSLPPRGRFGVGAAPQNRTLPRLAHRASVSNRKGARRLCNPGGVSPSLPIDRTCIAGALFIWGMSPHRALRGMTSLKSKSHGGVHAPGVERSSAGTCSKARRVPFQKSDKPCHARAGGHLFLRKTQTSVKTDRWTPAFAGMTHTPASRALPGAAR